MDAGRRRRRRSSPRAQPAERVLRGGRRAVYRHTLLVRIWHWLNALCLFVLLLSGLQILNAHPALYWGNSSLFSDPWMRLASGYHRAFPSWITLPPWQDLAAGRHWHFFFAWIFVVSGMGYVIYLFASRRVRRELWPSAGEMHHLGQSFGEHLRLKFPEGEAARHYNPLQKLSYLIVLFALLPLMVLTGLTMSPAMDARFHFLPLMFGGRQSARTIHFLTACVLVLFFLIHMLALLAAGPIREMRAIITGWFVIDTRKEVK